MKKQLAAASGVRNATQTFELIYGHITNAYHYDAPGVVPEGKYAEAVNVLEFFQMSQLNIIDGFPIFSCSAKAATTCYAARTNTQQSEKPLCDT